MSEIGIISDGITVLYAGPLSISISSESYNYNYIGMFINLKKKRGKNDYQESDIVSTCLIIGDFTSKFQV